MAVLRIDTGPIKAHAELLGQMHRSALPNAVRNTLNRTAFDVKTNTMPKESDAFTHRRPTFFKANSKVEPAKGYEVGEMRATVGFMENHGTQEQAVEDLERQENAGDIGGRAMIPLNAARAGNRVTGNVRAANRISQISSKIVDSEDSEGSGAGQRFTKAALHAGKGGFVIGNKKNSKGNRLLYKINSIKRLKKATTTKAGKTYQRGNTVINSTAVYSVKAGRHVHVRERHFMRKASMRSALKMDGYFIEEAEKQIKRLRK